MTATAALRAALGRAPAEVDTAGLLGLEHEYQLEREREPVDFRLLIHDLPIPGRRLDPGDHYAYRCTSGLVVTCDDAEAEVASPPVALSAHFAGNLDRWARAGLSLLHDVVPPGTGLAGYSTHLSAAVADDQVEAVARRFVRRYAPAVMLVLDGPESHGIFVRPRPGRLELCGDYVIGRRLQAASALFAGAARACASEAVGHPPELDVNVVPARGRFGMQLDRRAAFGFDLYVDGRRGRLPLASGGTVSVQSHLELAWASARTALGPSVADADVAACDRIVEGSLPLGTECADGADGARAVDGDVATHGPSPFGDLLAPRRRPAFRVEAVLATWAYTVFEVAAVEGQRFVCVPRASLPQFLSRLDGGRLDAVLVTALRTPARGLRLERFDQTREVGIWEALTVSPALVPPEPGAALHELVGQRAGKAGAGSPPPGRPGKRPSSGVPLAAREEPRALPPLTPPSIPPPVTTTAVPVVTGRGRGSRRQPWPALIALVAVAILAVGLALAVRGFGPEDETVRQVAPTSTNAASTSTTPSTAATTVPTTQAATTTSTRPPPTTTVTGPTTTAGPATTTSSTVPATTTSTTLPFLITVSPNCAFNPPTATRPKGSAIRFLNSASVPVTVSGVGPPGSLPASFTVPPGGLSPPYVLGPAGTYTFSCSGSGSGSMVIVAI